jgi:ABC-type antimicrobial peptide transport system permease subunit
LGRTFMIEVGPTGVNDTTPVRRVARPQAFLNLAPGLRFSSFPQFENQNLGVSLPQFIRRSTTMTSIREIKYDQFIISVGEKSQVLSLYRDLKDILALYSSDITISNYYDEIKNLDTAKLILDFFFIFTQVMAMVICFFALMSSMAANVHEQAKEIGILRAIGMKPFPLKRLYIEEAFTVVVSASLLGVVVGVGVAYTMSIQQSLFTQLPLPFLFPWQQLLVVVIVAVVGSFVSSYGPITQLLNLPSIPHILRRTI